MRRMKADCPLMGLGPVGGGASMGGGVSKGNLNMRYLLQNL